MGDLDRLLTGWATPKFPIIRDWPFPDASVSRMLQDDIPRRVRRGTGRIWVDRDPDGLLVGFGTIDERDHYGVDTGGRDHPDIPLPSMNRTISGRGSGTSIVRHLIQAATDLAGGAGAIQDVLFLDVDTDNDKSRLRVERDSSPRRQRCLETSGRTPPDRDSRSPSP